MSFTNYLKKYRNTICGRHPIGVLLNVSGRKAEFLKSRQISPQPALVWTGGGLEFCVSIKNKPVHRTATVALKLKSQKQIPHTKDQSDK